MRPKGVWVWVARGFGCGAVPWAPGTAGSAIGLLWFAVLAHFAGGWWTYGLGVAAGLGLSVVATGFAEEALGEHDPPSVVIDEIAAMPLVFAGWLGVEGMRAGHWAGLEWVMTVRGGCAILAGFVAFRLFDIWKPWVIRWSQRLPGGWGVTADDVLAALAANVAWLAFGMW